jgi:hypothetical protein
MQPREINYSDESRIELSFAGLEDGICAKNEKIEITATCYRSGRKARPAALAAKEARAMGQACSCT